MTANFSANPLASFLSADQSGLSKSATSLTNTPAPVGANSEGTASEVSFSVVLQGQAPGQLSDSANPTTALPTPLAGDAPASIAVFQSLVSDSIMSAELPVTSGLTTPPGGNGLPVNLVAATGTETIVPENPIEANIILNNLQSDELDPASVDFTAAISPNGATPIETQVVAMAQTGAVREQAPAAFATAKQIKTQSDASAPTLMMPTAARESLAQVQAQIAPTQSPGNAAAQFQSEALPPPVAMQNVLKQQMMNSAKSPTSTLPGVSGLTGVDSAAGDEAFILQTGQTSATAAAVERPATLQSTPTLSTIPRAIGTPGWNQGLGQRMLLMVDNGLNQAELRLDPPQLGSIHVRIAMSDDQAQLFFQAAHPAAREALESALPKLREMFAEQGLQLDNADIGGESQQSASDKANGESESQDATAVAEGQEQNSDGPEGSHNASAGAAPQGLIDEFV